MDAYAAVLDKRSRSRLKAGIRFSCFHTGHVEGLFSNHPHSVTSPLTRFAAALQDVRHGLEMIKCRAVLKDFEIVHFLLDLKEISGQKDCAPSPLKSLARALGACAHQLAARTRCTRPGTCGTALSHSRTAVLSFWKNSSVQTLHLSAIYDMCLLASSVQSGIRLPCHFIQVFTADGEPAEQLCPFYLSKLGNMHLVAVYRCRAHSPQKSLEQAIATDDRALHIINTLITNYSNGKVSQVRGLER